MSLRLIWKAVLSILVGVGLLILTELILRDVIHIDVTGHSTAWLPIILSAVPLLFVLFKENWEGKPKWKRVAQGFSYMFVLVAVDIIALIFWSCSNGVCI